VPKADNRAEVEKSIDRMQQQAAAEEAARAAEEADARRKADEDARKIPVEDPVADPGGGTTAPPATGDPELDRVAGMDVAAIRDQRGVVPATTGGGGAATTGGSGGPPPPPAPSEPRKSKPIYKQWWFWVVAGVSAYVLISILASDSSEDTPDTFRVLPELDAPTPSAGWTYRF
jgi:hypothetical protein